MIAIAPQIGTSETQATPSPSPVTPAGQAGDQSFSSILEQASSSVLAQAKTFPSHSLGDQAGATHLVSQGGYPAISDPSKRDGKKSDSKSTDPKMADFKSADSKMSGSHNHGNAVTQTPASSPDPTDQAVPAVVAPTLPLPAFALPVLAWDADIQNLTPDMQVGGATVGAATVGAATNDHGAVSPAPSGIELGIEPAINTGASSGPASLPTLFKDAVEVKPLEDTRSQNSPNQAVMKTASVAAINAEAVAGLTAKLPGTAASDSKMSPANVPAPAQAHNVSRGSVQTADGTGKTLAALKSEIEQVLAPPTSVSAIVPPSASSGNFDPASLQGTALKAGSDKSRVGATQIGATQDGSGTTTKNVDVTGSAKAQTRKDDSQSSLSSPAPDPSAISAPAKAIDSSQVFSVSGTQTSPATGNGKTVTAGVPQDPSDPKAGQLDHTSTGVAQSQQGESAATYPTSLVHSAKLIERVGEAELRLGIRAGEFGSVDVRTSMVRNQFTAEISTERGELGRAMAAELPSLQNRLSEQRVPVANITLQNQTGNQSSASEQQKPRDGQPVYAMNQGSGREEGPMAALVALEGTAPTSGLDIHM